MSQPADVPGCAKWLRFTNIVNATLLSTIAILAPLLTNTDFDTLLCAGYVFGFSQVLLCFETHFQCIQPMIYRDCGFMFTVVGRVLFFLFVGTLAFGLGDLGIIAGAFTVVNVCFNMYVLYAFPDFTERQKIRCEEERRKAAIQAQTNMAMGQLGAKAAQVGALDIDANGQVRINQNALAKMAMADQAWTSYIDDNTGKTYYHNSITQETRWKKPKGSNLDTNLIA